jgi:hypothetical protein
MDSANKLLVVNGAVNKGPGSSGSYIVIVFVAPAGPGSDRNYATAGGQELAADSSSVCVGNRGLQNPDTAGQTAGPGIPSSTPEIPVHSAGDWRNRVVSVIAACSSRSTVGVADLRASRRRRRRRESWTGRGIVVHKYRQPAAYCEIRSRPKSEKCASAGASGVENAVARVGES